MLSLCAVLLGVPCSLAVDQDLTSSISDVVFQITASSDLGFAEYSAYFWDGVWDPEDLTFSWNLPSELELLDLQNGEWIATLTNAALFVRADRGGEIELSMGLISGLAVTDVSIGSPLVTLLKPIPAPQARGRASASITLTDGENNDAMIYGLTGDGRGIFLAFYNGYLSAGTRFSHLVGLIAIEGGGTVTASQSDPIVGYRPVDHVVRNVSAEIAFTVTPLELAFATTMLGFPEPESEPCPGDLNGDGMVDVYDLAELLGYYGCCENDPGYATEYDLDLDGCVQLSDLSELLRLYGVVCW